MTFVSAHLTKSHQVADFDCGVPDLNRWLVTEAMRAQEQGTARTTVWLSQGDVVVAYYSVAPTQVERSDVTRRLSGGVSRIPGYVLARLALDVSLQGQHVGSKLLIDALETICVAAASGGGRIIVVDPVDDNATRFYRHFQFEPVRDSNRMYMLIQDARRTLDASG